jgi:hypothetical protein
VCVVRVATRWVSVYRRDAKQSRKKEENNYQNRFRLSLRQHHHPTHLNSTSKKEKIKRASSTSSSQENKERDTHTGRIWPIKINNWLPVIIPHLPATTTTAATFSLLFQISLITRQLTTVSLFPPTISSYSCLNFFFLNARTHTHTHKSRKKKEPVGDNGLPCRVFLPEGGDTLSIYFSSNEYIASGKK